MKNEKYKKSSVFLLIIFYNCSRTAVQKGREKICVQNYFTLFCIAYKVFNLKEYFVFNKNLSYMMLIITWCLCFGLFIFPFEISTWLIRSFRFYHDIFTLNSVRLSNNIKIQRSISFPPYCCHMLIFIATDLFDGPSIYCDVRTNPF